MPHLLSAAESHPGNNLDTMPNNNKNNKSSANDRRTTSPNRNIIDCRNCHWDCCYCGGNISEASHNQKHEQRSNKPEIENALLLQITGMAGHHIATIANVIIVNNNNNDIHHSTSIIKQSNSHQSTLNELTPTLISIVPVIGNGVESSETHHFDHSVNRRTELALNYANNCSSSNNSSNNSFNNNNNYQLLDRKPIKRSNERRRKSQTESTKTRISLINVRSTFVFLLTTWLTLSSLIVINMASPAEIALNRAAHRKALNSTATLFESSSSPSSSSSSSPPPSPLIPSLSSQLTMPAAATLNRTGQQNSQSSHADSLLFRMSQIKLSSLDNLLREETLEDAILKLTQTWEQIRGSTRSASAESSNVDAPVANGDSIGDQMISTQVTLDSVSQQAASQAKSHYRLHRRSVESEPISAASKSKASKISDDDRTMSKDDSRVYQYQTLNAHKSNPVSNEWSSQAESIIKSLNEQQAARSWDKRLPPMALNCSRCMANEEARRMQIETIKFNILSKLGMNQVPNISHSALPQIPPIRHYLDRFNSMLSDDPRAYDPKKGSGFTTEYFGPTNRESDSDGGDDFFINPERSIVFAQKPPTDRTVPDIRAEYFSFPASIVNSHVERAHLWLYLKPTKSNREEDGSGVIVIYQVVRPEFEGAPTRALARKKKVNELTLRKGGWIQVDIKKLVSKWFQNPDTNLGISIDSYDNDGIPLTILHHDDAALDTALRPFVEVRVTTAQHGKRKRRNTELTCEEQSTEVRCCRYPLTVDFEEFGWEWIIAPKRYVANYCSGECPYIVMPNYPHTHLINQQTQNSHRPCCAPRRMTSMSMIYLDDKQNIIYGLMPNMVVDRCGCS